MNILDREYLEDYEQREYEEYKRLVEKRIQEGKFDFEKDRYPPDDRFVKLQKPVAITTARTSIISDLWAQAPFCGSLSVSLVPVPRPLFEECYFKTSEIPKIVDFIKDTGKFQIVLYDYPTRYEGLDYLELIFKELKPPVYYIAPLSIFGSEKEIQMTNDAFFTLANVKYLDFLRRASQHLVPTFQSVIERDLAAYMKLKLNGYTQIAEAIENSMIDDPIAAFTLFRIFKKFITVFIGDLFADESNFALEEIKEAQSLPLVYQPRDIRFPCEIGTFLVKKMTYAPLGMRACYDIIDHYDAYDLRKVQESLNDAIVTNHPDVVNKSAEELSEILDNVWNDQAVPRQIKNLERGLPISIAAIGTAVSAFTGGIEGFLAGLGFSVGAKFLEASIEGLSEKIARFFARSYQANVYDFKEKYKDRIVRERHEKAK